LGTRGAGFFPLIGTVFFMTLLVCLAVLLPGVPGVIVLMGWYVPIPAVLLAGLQLVVPVLILLTMWYVAIPACVVEQTGPWMSLSRSAALTNGNRWKVFGLITLVIIISYIGAVLIGALVKAAGATGGLLAALIWNALFGAFFAILMGVTYHDLRIAKEGVDTDQIGAVFE
jgi:hypothetical protein